MSCLLKERKSKFSVITWLVKVAAKSIFLYSHAFFFFLQANKKQIIINENLVNVL